MELVSATSLLTFLQLWLLASCIYTGLFVIVCWYAHHEAYPWLVTVLPWWVIPRFCGWRLSSNFSGTKLSQSRRLGWPLLPDKRKIIEWAYSPSSKGKGKGFPYSTPSVGPGADPGIQAVSPHVTVSHPPGGRLPLLSTGPAVTSPAAEHHRPLAGTKLYCLVTEAHRCKQLA